MQVNDEKRTEANQINDLENRLLDMGYVEGDIEDLYNVSVYNFTYLNSVANNITIHSHEKHELVIFWSQSVRLFCDDTIIHSSGYNAYFCPAGHEHYQMNQPTGFYKRFYVQFPVSFLAPNEVEQNLNVFFFCPLQEEDISEIQPYIDLLLKTGEAQESKWNQNAQKHLLILLFNEFARRFQERTEPTKTTTQKRERRIFTICSFIHQHYSEKITIEQLAELASVSKTTLTQQFREVLGISIIEYVRKVRVTYAMQYIANGYSVSETALLCGFCDAAYFIRVFRSITGITPKEYSKH